MDTFHQLRILNHDYKRQHHRLVRLVTEMVTLRTRVRSAMIDDFFGLHPLDNAFVEATWKRLNELTPALHHERANFLILRGQFTQLADAFHPHPNRYYGLKYPGDVFCLAKIIQRHLGQEYFVANRAGTGVSQFRFLTQTFARLFGYLIFQDTLYAVSSGAGFIWNVREATAAERQAHLFNRA